MGKRILSFLLILALFPLCLAVPVMADEIEEDGFYDLLDYGFPNGGSSTVVNVSSDSPYVSFNLPFSNSLKYIDVVVSSSATFDYVYLWNGKDGAGLTVLNITDGLYRIYGSLPSDVHGSFTLEFMGFTERITFNFLSVKVSSVPLSYENISAYGSGGAYGTTTKELTITDVGSRCSWSYSSYNDFVSHMGAFALNLYSSEWNAYDYVYMSLSMEIEAVSSITARIGSIPLSCEVSYLASPDSASSLYIVDILVDISGVDRNSTDDLCITINGNSVTWMDSSFSYILLRDAKGYVVIDEQSPLVYWFNKLNGWIQSQTSSIGSWITSQTNALSSSFTSVGNSITSSIATLGSNVSNAITTNFDRLFGWVTDQTSTLKASIDALPEKIAEELKDLVVPQDGAIESMATKSEGLVADRFGGVFEGAQIVDNWAGQLEAQAATQILTVPVVEMNILGKLFPIGGWEVDLVPDGFEIIFESVKIIIDILATTAFVNGIKFRLERTLER